MSADNKNKKSAPKLRIVKNDPPKKDKGLQPKSEIGKALNDFANQLQQQIDAIMRL